ncbi:uncharacterized protein LOC133171629 [Saccostrea echinata]|uniref:uncharacterized protein LOC133171629 n=1 Tax=Saccostrea echinata TaxID=191078 RepID=UPI002A81B5AE|nr:uncharacterized protein LOC133171629 [Saccostrea echinata]
MFSDISVKRTFKDKSESYYAEVVIGIVCGCVILGIALYFFLDCCMCWSRRRRTTSGLKLNNSSTQHTTITPNNSAGILLPPQLNHYDGQYYTAFHDEMGVHGQTYGNSSLPHKEESVPFYE